MLFWFFYFVLPVLIVLVPAAIAIAADEEFFGFVAVILAICAVIYYVFVGCFAADRHFNKASCHSYAAKTGRPTKFVRYPAWTTDCLTPAHDGKWLPTDQIGDYNK